MAGLSTEIRWDIIAQEIIKGSNQTEAYLKGFPDAKKWTRRSLTQRASELCTRKVFLDVLEHWKAEAAKAFSYEMAEIVEHLHDLGTVNLQQMYDQEGNILPIEKMPPKVANALNAIEHETIVKIERDANGDETRTPMPYISKFRIHNKLDALGKLYAFKKAELDQPPEERDGEEIDKKHLARKLLKLSYEGVKGIR